METPSLSICKSVSPPPDSPRPSCTEKNTDIVYCCNIQEELQPIATEEATNAAENIHDLLRYVHKRGITWVPDSLEKDRAGNYILTHLKGTVPADLPYWIWKDSILIDIARHLRQWHDATIRFRPKTDRWLISTDEPGEVICHNDFTPCNSVFSNGKFCGLVDFDLCSPGSRLWDIAYAAYRFVPLMPDNRDHNIYEYSPFSIDVTRQRLAIFLETYAGGDRNLHYDQSIVLLKTRKRLLTHAQCTDTPVYLTTKKHFREEAEMYTRHADWIKEQL